MEHFTVFVYIHLIVLVAVLGVHIAVIVRLSAGNGSESILFMGL